MKSRLILFFIFTLSSAYAGTISGTLQGPSGTTINNAILTFQLQQAGLIAGVGSVVPLTASCYTSNNGTIVGIPNPVAAVQSSVTYGAGTLPEGTYFVETTFYDGNQETLPSPELRVQLTDTGTLIINPAISFPLNATGMKVYIGTTSGGEAFQGQTFIPSAQYSQGVALTTGASIPTVNSSVCSIAFNDTIIPYSGYKVSLVSSTGNAYPGWPQEWQLNGGLNGTVDISNGAPLWNGVIVYPQPIVAQPLNHGPQSISGSVGLGGYNLFNVGAIGLGTATPGWPIDVENGAINSSGGFIYNGAAPTGHLLVGNGTAYVDALGLPASAITGLFYQTMYSSGTARPQESGLNFSKNFSLTDGATTSVEMSLTGVADGTYINPTITIDNYGRIDSASNGTAVPITKVLIVTSGICTTANSAYSTCLMSPNWPSAFSDTSYAVTCQADSPSSTSSTSTVMLYVTAKSTTGITIEIQNGDTTSAGPTTVSEIDCIGVHP